MDYNYIIEVTMPNDGEVRYLTRYNDSTTDPLRAKGYTENSEEALRRLNYLSRELKPRLIDRRQLLGTYISTYNNKFTFSKVLDVIGNSYLLSLITLPIMLPIALMIRIVKEIDERY
jgi:hypothetical protein